MEIPQKLPGEIFWASALAPSDPWVSSPRTIRAASAPASEQRRSTVAEDETGGRSRLRGGGSRLRGRSGLSPSVRLIY